MLPCKYIVILNKGVMYSFRMCGLGCQMGVVFMFFREYFAMPKEGGVVYVLVGGRGWGHCGGLLGSSLARSCIVTMTRIPNCAKTFEGGRGYRCGGLLGPGLVSLYVVLLPRIRNCAQIL